MSSNPISLRDQLVTNLRSIESQTQDIFMALAESLPQLVTEMKKSLTQSYDAINCMDASGTTDCDGGIEISALVGEIRREMEHSTERFTEMSERDSELFERLQVGIGQLETIASAIADIRGDSEDMELVSLNAMTVALKAGAAGRAFSYITEELKRLANRTINLSEEITNRGNNLITNFRGLEEILEDARTFQSRLVDSAQNRIDDGLSELEMAVQRTVADLKELRDESSQLQEPVNGMMEAIQLQDLIRQSIDHIIIALNAMEPEDDLLTDTALLDELSFMRQIPGLASRLIDDVAEQIDASVSTFLSLTSDAETKLSELEHAQRSFLASNVETGVYTEKHKDEGAVTLDERFHHASEMLQTLLNDLEQNIKKKESLVVRSGAITKEVQELESQFQTFTTLVNRFHSIDIASRIEVAKQTVLRQMGTSAEQMTALTRTIEKDVNRSLEATQEFIKSTSTIIDSHHIHFEEENRLVQSISESIRTRYRSLAESREAIIRVVGGFSLFTSGFVKVFQTSKENGTRLSSLSSGIRDLKSNLEEIQSVIDTRYDEELRNQGLSSWSIENDRLRSIIERFTIFTHKQQAGDMVGFEIEEGVEAGDVTLF
jgi:methyl-accepting chemotaxis protein